MKTRYSDPQTCSQRIRVFALAVEPEKAIEAVESRGGRAGTYAYVADRLAEGLSLERALEYLDAGVDPDLVRSWENLRTSSAVLPLCPSLGEVARHVFRRAEG